ncbi:hypothetical protein GIB67_013222 [Kingdonia uniflora]|uniref:Uncharacterized protein n=1 Tax=Kingdonia uniflora TaxID=39325 RepID=A0A7J7P4W4_9MAGN|nr:hypothetical protein GIB67_013222 [Kingdonia uniflora]
MSLRKDILDDLCLSKPVNTTLDSSPFQLPLDNSIMAFTTNDGLYYQIVEVMGSDQRAPTQLISFSECTTSIVIPALPLVIATQMSSLMQFPPVTSALNKVINGGFNVKYEESVNSECVVPCIKKGRGCVYSTEGFTCQSRSKNLRRNVAIAVGSAAGFCVFLLIISLSIYRRRKTSSNNSVFFWKSSKQAQKVEDFLSKCGFLAPKRYTYFDIKKMTNSFEDKLGQGGFGGVFKGKTT